MNKLVRLQVEITQEQMDKLERLQALACLRTKKDLLDNALTLFHWALKEKARGCSIVSVHEKAGTWKELEMPCLEHAANSPDPSIPTPSTPHKSLEGKGGWRTKRKHAVNNA